MALLTIWAVNYPWWDELMCRTQRWLRIDEYLVCRVRRVCHAARQRGEHTDARDNASVIRGTVRHCNEYRHARPRPERRAARSGKGVDLSQRAAGFGRQAVLEPEAAKENRTVVHGALGIDRANLFVEPFQKKYPNVKIDFVRLANPILPTSCY